MWKKVISLFLVTCLLTTIVGCGGGNPVVPQLPESTPEPVDDLVVEEESFNVVADESCVFEITDGAKVEIGKNGLNKNATLTILKLEFSSIKRSSSDFVIVSAIYSVKLNGQNVQILEPIKISLPIPTGIDVSNIAIVHFYEDGQYDIVNGIISLDGKFISIEVTELSLFGIIDFVISGDIETLPFIDTIIDSYIDVINVAQNWDYDTLQAMTILWENEFKRAEEAMDVSAGISPEDVVKIGVMIYTGFGIKFLVAKCFAFLIKAGIVSKPILEGMGFVISLSGTLDDIADFLDTNIDDVAIEVVDYYTAYIIYNQCLKAYQIIGLEGLVDVLPKEGPAPLKVYLDGDVSGGTRPYTWQWDCGDGYWSPETQDTERSIYYTYEEPGKYTPILYAEDAEGKKGRFIAGEVTVTESDIDGDITNVSPLTDPFTLGTWYTTSVYVKNIGNTSHTFKVKASEPSGTNFEITQKNLTLNAGASSSTSFKYKFYGTETGRSLVFKLYDSSNNLLDVYTTETLYSNIDDEKTLKSLTVVPDSMSFSAVGQTKDITEIILTWSNDTTTSLAEGNATYYSYNTSVADVTGTSFIKVESKGEGDTLIKVSYTDNEVTRSDYINVTVGGSTSTKILTSLTVDPDTMSFSAAGQTKYISEITLGWRRSDGTTYSSYLAKGDAVYYVYNTSVAKIVMAIPSVYVQSVGTGSTNVKVSYTYNGVTKYDYIAVTVGGTPPPTKTLTSLTVSPDSMSFSTVGQTIYISEIILGWSDGSTSYLAKGDATYNNYSTSVVNIIKVIPNVKVQSVGEGSTNIKVSYTDNGVTKYDYIAVTVENAPAELQYIEAYPKNMAFDLNDTNKCDDVTQVVARYSDGSLENIDINSVSYLSNNTGVATVNSSGTVCGVGEGNTTIKVTYQGEYDTISVSVSDSGITPPSVKTLEGTFNGVDLYGDAYIGVPGKITGTGGENAYERGFEYQDLAGGSIKIKNYYGDYGTGAWYRPLYIGSEVYSGHSYKYRAYAVNSAGTGYGVWRTFTVN